MQESADVKQLRYVEQEYATVGETQLVINTMGGRCYGR